MRFTLFALITLLAACTSLEEVGRVPEFSPAQQGGEYSAMVMPGLPTRIEGRRSFDQASLWTQGQTSLLGDRRAVKRGDILTVVIEIDDSASISNSTSGTRSGSSEMAIPHLLGIPQRINEGMAPSTSLDTAISTNSSSQSSGQGSVTRNEKLELRVAATVVEVLPNGVLQIEGTQEVRVNYEIRELLVGGYVRPEDISRLNEITYDKIASARISYGGRGQISRLQQPRYGQQVIDILAPF